MTRQINPEDVLAAVDAVGDCGGMERFEQMCTPDVVRSLVLRLRAASSNLRELGVENDLMISPLLRHQRAQPRRHESAH